MLTNVFNTLSLKKAFSLTKALCLGLVLISVSQLSIAASISGVRLWRAPDNTRLVFDLNGYTEHSLFTLDKPNRIVIDLKSASLATNFSHLDLSNTPIVGIRSAEQKQQGLRIVLDLKQAVNPRSLYLSANEQYGERLVIDLYDEVKEQKTTIADALSSENTNRDIIIAIDAGHGGDDPGALGPKRIKEKTVTLAISKALKKIIDKEPGFTAKLTRKGDYGISLRKRTKIAREFRADLFVSIHADSFTHPAAKGASVFALSSKGATSEAARYLAKRENQADLIGGVGNLNISNKDPMLAGVLLDLSMTAVLSASLDVGQQVLNRIGRFARLHNKQLELANFAVLKSPDVPSILVETGFISNPSEARKLANKNYQNQLASAIFTGVKQYFHTTPPPNSWLANQKSKKPPAIYVVARGDTLSAIAARYNMNTKTLQQHNRLRSTIIRVGQRLKIPIN